MHKLCSVTDDARSSPRIRCELNTEYGANGMCVDIYYPLSCDGKKMKSMHYHSLINCHYTPKKLHNIFIQCVFRRTAKMLCCGR